VALDLMSNAVSNAYSARGCCLSNNMTVMLLVTSAYSVAA